MTTKRKAKSPKKSKNVSATVRHEKFAIEYCKSLNASQAAIAAGYSERTARQQGSRLLSNANILARIRELQDELLEKLPISVYWVIEQYIQVYNRCMQKEPVMKWDYSEKKLVETGEWQFDSRGANSALDSIGKYLGMFTNKVEHSGNIQTDGEDKLAMILTQLTAEPTGDEVKAVDD